MLKCLYVLSKKYLTFIPQEHKPFWQLSQLDDFVSNTIERLETPEAYSEPIWTTKMEL